MTFVRIRAALRALITAYLGPSPRNRIIPGTPASSAAAGAVEISDYKKRSAEKFLFGLIQFVVRTLLV